MLRHSGHQPKLLWKLLSEQPKFFVQVLELNYRPEGGPKQGPSKDHDEIERARAACEILDSWEGSPGAELSPDEREEYLYQWTRSVLDHAQEYRRSRGATIEVARVLARAPYGKDKLWPCLAARRFLEEHLDGLFGCLRAEGFNRRGVVSKEVGEGESRNEALPLPTEKERSSFVLSIPKQPSYYSAWLSPTNVTPRVRNCEVAAIAAVMGWKHRVKNRTPSPTVV